MEISFSSPWATLLTFDIYIVVDNDPEKSDFTLSIQNI
jgi:hypothetical protein